MQPQLPTYGMARSLIAARSFTVTEAAAAAAAAAEY